MGKYPKNSGMQKKVVLDNFIQPSMIKNEKNILLSPAQIEFSFHFDVDMVLDDV